MDTLPAAFRARRIALRMSQADVADAAGISRGTLTAFENGDGRISLANLRRLMSAVGLSLTIREATRRPTLDELAEHYAADPEAQTRRRASKGRRSAK